MIVLPHFHIGVRQVTRRKLDRMIVFGHALLPRNTGEKTWPMKPPSSSNWPLKLSLPT
jgi:hypothetical protein